MPKKKPYQKQQQGEKTVYTERYWERLLGYRSRYTKEELKNAIRQDGKPILESILEEYPLDEMNLEPQRLETFLKDAFPDHISPEPATRALRERQREQVTAKLNALGTRSWMLFEALAEPGKKSVGRPPFLLTDFSEEGIAQAERYIRARQSGDRTAEKNALVEQMLRIGRIDLNRLDPLKPETFLNYMEDVMNVSLLGGEIPNLLRDMPELREDPRLTDFWDKAELMYELSGILRPALDMMCSSLYAEMGLLENAEIREYQLGRKAEIHEGEEIEDEVNSVEDKYLNTDLLDEADTSAFTYFAQLRTIHLMASPLLDSTKTMEERLEVADEANDILEVRKYRKNEAPEIILNKPNSRLPSSGQVPVLDEELRAVVVPYLRGGDAAQKTVPSFHPAARGDVKRLFVKNSKGTFVPAFPEALQNGEWNGLTETQLMDIFSSNGKYAYFPAGSTRPQLFMSGVLTKVEHPYRLDFGQEGTDRIILWPDTKRKNETRIHELEVGKFSILEVEDSLAAVYGSKLTDIGTERTRSFHQVLVNKLAQEPGTGYPDPKGKLTEADVTALSLLSVANPDVNGRQYGPTEYPEGVAMAGFGMIANDMMIQRQASNTGIFTNWARDARAYLSPILEHYYSKDGKAADLAETIVKGIHTIATNCSNKSSITMATVSEMIPAKRVSDLLENHPDLLRAARDYARAHGQLEKLEKDLYQCRNSARFYEKEMNLMEEEAILLAAENGELTRENGQPASLSPEEEEKLKLDLRIGEFLKGVCAKHDSRSEEMADADGIREVTEKMPQIFVRFAEAEEARHAAETARQELAQADRQIEGLEKELLAAEQELENLRREPQAEAEQIAAAPKQEAQPGQEQDERPTVEQQEKTVRDLQGLLEAKRAERPALQERLNEAEARYARDPYTAEDQSMAQKCYAAQIEYIQREMPISPVFELVFSHTGGMEALETIMKIMKGMDDPDDVIHLLGDLNLIPDDAKPDPNFDFDQAIRNFQQTAAKNFSAERDEILRAQYQDMLDELGLDVEDLRTMAMNKGISVEEYARRMMDETRQAEERSPASPAHLDDIAEQISPERISEITPERMCKGIQKLNLISKHNQEDLQTESRCEELLNRLYQHMVAYEKQHPEFTKQKDRILKVGDYLDAQQTIRRGVHAAQVLNGVIPEAQTRTRISEKGTKTIEQPTLKQKNMIP